MRTALIWFAAPLALAVGLYARPMLAAEPNENTKDEAAIKKNAKAFVAAFDKGDAKAVAGFWAPEGDYVEETGRHMKGREEIEKAFTEFFSANKGLKVRIRTESLRFVTPDVAVEDGVTLGLGAGRRAAEPRPLHRRPRQKGWEMDAGQRPRLALRPAQQLRAFEGVGMDDRRLGG